MIEFKNIKKNKMFSKLSLTIIKFVFVITLTNAIAASLISSYNTKKETYANNAALLSKISRIVENRIDDIDKALVKFCLGNLDTNLTENVADLYNRWSVIFKSIDILAASYDFIDSVYLYFNGGNNVFYYSLDDGKNGVMVKNNFFDRMVYESFVSGTKLSQFTGVRKIVPVYSEISKSKPENVISVIKRLPLYKRYAEDAIVVNFKEEFLMKIIADNYVPQKHIMVISDRSKNVILSLNQSGNSRFDNIDIGRIVGEREWTGEEQTSYSVKIYNEKCYVTQMTLDTYNWVYTLIVSEKELFKSIKQVNLAMFLLSGLMLVLGIVFSTKTDKKFFQPVLGILQNLSSRAAVVPEDNKKNDKSPKNDEFNKINRYIDNMILKNAAQEKLLKDQETELKQYSLYYKEKILHGLLEGDKEIIELQKKNQLFSNRDYKCFSVVLINFRRKENAKDEANHFAFVNSILQKFITVMSDCGCMEKIKINRSKIALLLCMKNNYILMQDLKERLSKIQDNSYSINVCIGSIHGKMKDIYKSYMETERILQYALQYDESRVLSIDDLINQSEADREIVFPFEIEKQIYKNIASDNYEDVKSAIRLFFKSMSENRIDMKRGKKYIIILIYNISLEQLKRNECIANNLLTDDVLEELDTLSSFNFDSASNLVGLPKM